MPVVSLSPTPHTPIHPDAQELVLALIDSEPTKRIHLSSVQPRLNLDLGAFWGGLGFRKLKDFITSDQFPDVELHAGNGPGSEYLTHARGGGGGGGSGDGGGDGDGDGGGGGGGGGQSPSGGGSVLARHQSKTEQIIINIQARQEELQRAQENGDEEAITNIRVALDSHQDDLERHSAGGGSRAPIWARGLPVPSDPADGRGGSGTDVAGACIVFRRSRHRAPLSH